MSDAVKAYRSITATKEFRELERLREKVALDEANALSTAESRGEKRADEKWQGVVADKDAVIADKDAALAEKDVALADKNAENERLRKENAELRARRVKNK